MFQATTMDGQMRRGKQRASILVVVTPLLLAIFAVLILGARSRNMEPDEGISIQDTAISMSATMDREIRDIEAPLYYLSFYFWQDLAGRHEFTDRVFSLLTSMLTAAMVYRIGHRTSQWTGVAALIALGFSSYFFIYALQIRPYPQMILITTLSMWFFIRWLESKRWRHALIYAVTMSLLMYVHYFGSLVILIQVVYFLIFHRKSGWLLWKQALAAALLAFVCWLPWFPVFITQVVRSGSFVKSTDTLIPGIGKGGPKLVTSPRNVARFVRMATNGQPIMFAAITLFGVSQLWRKRLFWLFAGWAFGVPAVMFVLNMIVPAYETQYISNIAPGLAVVVGLSLDRIPQRWKLSGSAAFATIVLVTVTYAVNTAATPIRDLLRNFSDAYRPEEGVYLEGVVIDDMARSQYSEYAPAAWANAIQLDPAITLSGEDLPGCLWYITRDWSALQVQARFNQLAPTHALQSVIGDERYLFVEFCAPPDNQAHRFGDSIEFRGSTAEIKAPHQLDLRLWWSSARQPPDEYIFRIEVIDAAGAVVAHHEGTINTPWSTAPLGSLFLSPGGMVQDNIPIPLPANPPTGAYQLGISVRLRDDPHELPVDGSPDTRLIFSQITP